MKTTTYKITHKDDKGAMYLAYQDGVLRQLINEFDFTIEEVEVFLGETHLHGWFKEMHPYFNITELKPRSVADKVALFCMKHKEMLGFAYRAMKAEKANLKDVTVNDEYLKVYFTNKDYPLTGAKSMADYVRHYNTVRNLVINGTPQKIKSRFPDVYDREFERTLEGETLSAYWQHLISKGWKKIDGAWRNY